MKILVVNYEYPPIGGGGGSSCKIIVEKLSERGHKVDVFTSGYKNFPSVEKINSNLTIYRIKSNRKSEHELGFCGLASFILRGSLKIKKIISKDKYDIIHYHFSVPTGFLSFFHNKKIPIAITLHGIDVPGFHEDEFPLFQKITKPFNKLIIKKASTVIAVSDTLKRCAEKVFPKKNINVIYHGIDTNIFKPSKIKKTHKKIKFICVARFVSFKRIDLLLKAFQFLLKRDKLNVELSIIGTGYMEQALKQLSDSLNLDTKTIFKGFIDNKLLPELLSEHDIFVMPSVHDSFGIVFLEAMACGLPCIGANSKGVPEVITDGETGLLAEPDDFESLYKCMKQLALEKELRNKMSINALNHAVNNCSWDKIVDKYETLFNDILNT